MKVFDRYFFKNIQQILINSYLFFMSLTIISLFVYFKLFVQRSSYSLEILKQIVGFKYLGLCFVLLCLHIFVVFFIIYNLLYKIQPKNKLIETIKFIIDFILWKPLSFLLDKISLHIPYSGTVIIYYCYFFRQNNFRLFLMHFLCFLLYFLPKIVMSILFFIEIIFYQKIEYFIKFIWILIVPLIYIIFINLCEKFYDNNITDVLEKVKVMHKGQPNQHGVYLEHTFQLKDSSIYSKEDLQEFMDAWYILFFLINLNKIIRLFISQCAPYVTLFVSVLYVISLSYKIYYLFII